MSNAPHVEIDLGAFWQDPYPTLAALRADAPIAFVPQLNGVVFSRYDDIVECEKRTDVFSSHQPDGLMNRLMGVNLMRKDGEAHRDERMAMLPTVAPQPVKNHWRARFQSFADAALAALRPRGAAELCREFAMPVSGEALKAITGLTQIRAADMDAWSQAMIDGIANYAGDAAMEARCRDATTRIDLAIDARLETLDVATDPSLLGAFLRAGMPLESIRANIKLTISGGQNEPRDAIAGTVWALLTHPQQHALIEAGDYSYTDAFEEYVRWISPIGMSPRRVAQPFEYQGVQLAPEDRVFFMFGSANRDASRFERAEQFDLRRDRKAQKHIAFGAGPHFCAGAAASRALIAEVAVPAVFARLPGLRLATGQAAEFGGWAFRGPLRLPLEWDAPPAAGSEPTNAGATP